MSLNLKKRDKLEIDGGKLKADSYLLVDKLFLFEGSPGGVGGFCV